MIPNTTPEEKAWWDREMDSYLKERTLSPRKSVLIILLFVVLFAIAVFAVERVFFQPAHRPVEEQLDDTLILDHSKIPDSL